MKKTMQTLRGAAGIAALILITLIGAIPLVPTSLAKLLAPSGRFRRKASASVLWVGRNWALAVNRALLGISGAQVVCEHEVASDPNGRYVLISNHQCWADVLLLIEAIDPQLPFPRYFIKEQLRWLPVIGLACWALDFPFMKRHTRAEIEKNPSLRDEDMETIRRACAVFRHEPVSLVNYAEGTRATAAKRRAANSPYQSLLAPKAGGTAFAVNAMRDVLDGVLDMTVAYVNAPEPTFWDMLSGRIPVIAIRVRRLDIPAELLEGDYSGDPAYRERFKDWLENVWVEKDKAVTALQDPANPARRFADLAAEPRNNQPADSVSPG